MNDIVNATAEIVAAKEVIVGHAAKVDQDRLAAIGSVAASVEASMGKLGLLNLLRNSGRFYDQTVAPKGYSQGLGSAPFSSYGFSAYNGSTVEDGGKFIANSSSYGGSTDPLPAHIKDLMDTMRHADGVRRYGAEFFVLKCTMGAGGAAGDANFPGHFTPVLFGHPLVFRTTTLLMWVVVESGSLELQDVGNRHVDGVALDGSQTYSSADGWKHSAHEINVNTGYLTNSASWFATEGTVFYVAVPVLASGSMVGIVHNAPVPNSSGDVQ